MSLIIKAVEFFYNNLKFIATNWYIFLVWTLLVIGVMLLIFKQKTKENEEKYKKIENDNKKLKEELKTQKEHYAKLETEAWAVSPKVKPSGNAATSLSESIQKKYCPKDR